MPVKIINHRASPRHLVLSGKGYVPTSKSQIINNLNAYDYNLPEELIASYPCDKRDSSRMLILNRLTGETQIKSFVSILDYLSSGDCLVVNNTRVIKARLFGLKEGTGAKIESMLIAPLNGSNEVWNCFIKPGKRVKEGTRVKLTSNVDRNIKKEDWYTVLKKGEDGTFEISFDSNNVPEILEKFGNIPLPPYIKRDAEPDDEIRYQTVYSKTSGAVAAPTAGLHFTSKILRKITEKGVNVAELTLHVGAGTFQPVSTDNILDHKMHSEEFFLSEKTAALINNTKASGGKILAVGTTTTRVLETLAKNDGFVKEGCGWTDIFLYPPYKPKVADMLLTNFHLPKSTLLMLVSTFAGRENILKAYQEAIDAKLSFYSYGDCMLLI